MQANTGNHTVKDGETGESEVCLHRNHLILNAVKEPVKGEVVVGNKRRGGEGKGVKAS